MTYAYILCLQNNMLDFVFAVDDPITWHTMNLIENRKHYSFLKYLGPKHISSIQNEYGAGVYYNTLVPSEERVSKSVKAFFISLFLLRNHDVVGMWFVLSISLMHLNPHHPKQQ